MYASPTKEKKGKSHTSAALGVHDAVGLVHDGLVTQELTEQKIVELSAFGKVRAGQADVVDESGSRTGHGYLVFLWAVYCGIVWVCRQGRVSCAMGTEKTKRNKDMNHMAA